MLFWQLSFEKNTYTGKQLKSLKQIRILISINLESKLLPDPKNFFVYWKDRLWLLWRVFKATLIRQIQPLIQSTFELFHLIFHISRSYAVLEGKISDTEILFVCHDKPLVSWFFFPALFCIQYLSLRQNVSV